MDQNKYIKLQEIGYTIKRVCSTCARSRFNGMSAFGVCRLHRYEHKKHADTTRELSIFRDGYCGNHQRNLRNLGPWEEFIEDA